MIGKAVIIGIVFVAIFLVVIVPNTHIPIGLGPIYDIPSTVTNQINDKVEEHNDEVDLKEFLMTPNVNRPRITITTNQIINFRSIYIIPETTRSL